MRWVSQIEHEALQINVYATEQRFVVKFEAGPMEQTYKIKKDVYPTLESIEIVVREVLAGEVMIHFESMFQTLVKAVEHAKQKPGS
jgi:L-ribulose-5-phosphate 3-epimerase UlaE